MNQTEDDKANLHDEEITLRIYGKNISIPHLIQNNKIYLILTNLSDADIESEFKANYTSLNWLLDMENCSVYLDFGYNRQLLTREILQNVTKFD